MARSAVTSSGPRCRHTPTTVSGRAPAARSRPASSAARLCSPAYVTQVAPATTATASGHSTARAVISSGTEMSSRTGAAVSFQAVSWSRSAPVSTGSTESRSPASAAAASSSTVRCPAILVAVASSNSAVLYSISPARPPFLDSRHVTVRSNLTACVPAIGSPADTAGSAGEAPTLAGASPAEPPCAWLKHAWNSGVRDLSRSVTSASTSISNGRS